MNNHIFSILLIVLVIGSSLNSCVEPHYMERNNQPERNERRHHRENHRNELRDGLRDDRKNEHSFGPFTFIFPQVSS
ncbi:MAG: hypothetical protein IPP96_13420 [Chitinophagaceae bacterium]|nr:hypothetical protein [Chitinophagaceae bacterium]